MIVSNLKKWVIGIGATASLGTGTVVAIDEQRNPYTDKETHFELPLVADFPQGERVEIAKGKAELTLKGWNDEYAIKIIPQIPTPSLGVTDRPFSVPANRKLLSKKMEFKSGDVTAFIEPKEGTQNEFDIDFTLDSKPDTNVFTYKIEGAEDFDFFYQPPLTPEEIAEGTSRPENVVGSYAVYHKTKANHRVGSTNYATGKAFHIYRPKAIDANGAETWAELDYQNGILSVIVPQKFLDDTVYPVRVDPTFGYTTAGASGTTMVGIIDGSRFVTTEEGTGTSITFYKGGTSSTKPIKCNVYVDSTDAALANGQTTASTPANGVGWVTQNFASSPTFAGSATYALVAWADDTTGTGSRTIFYDTGDTGQGGSDSQSYGAWPDPWVPSDDTRKYSIYATYTASGGGGGTGDDYGIIFY